MHHPQYQERRRRDGSKGGKRGGRGRPAVELAELRGQLSDLYSSVLTGHVEPKVGAVAAQIAHARTRLLETGLKVREQTELEERLAELESLLAQREEGRRWG
ncbi:MAG: hypothetical protein M3N18_09870 [Actinomycetota bacterium]|nr:hypothetical protein [Actinomycetota bacterium]